MNMQLINVSDRLCAIDDSVTVRAVTRLLSQLPPGIYIALTSQDSVLPGLEIAAQTAGIQVLRPVTKATVLPKIKKEVMLPVISQQPVMTAAPAAKKSPRQPIKLPTLQMPDMGKVLQFRSKTA